MDLLKKLCCPKKTAPDFEIPISLSRNLGPVNDKTIRNEYTGDLPMASINTEGEDANFSEIQKSVKRISSLTQHSLLTQSSNKLNNLSNFIKKSFNINTANKTSTCSEIGAENFKKSPSKADTNQYKNQKNNFPVALDYQDPIIQTTSGCERRDTEPVELLTPKNSKENLRKKSDEGGKFKHMAKILGIDAKKGFSGISFTKKAKSNKNFDESHIGKDGSPGSKNIVYSMDGFHCLKNTKYINKTKTLTKNDYHMRSNDVCGDKHMVSQFGDMVSKRKLSLSQAEDFQENILKDCRDFSGGNFDELSSSKDFRSGLANNKVTKSVEDFMSFIKNGMYKNICQETYKQNVKKTDLFRNVIGDVNTQKFSIEDFEIGVGDNDGINYGVNNESDLSKDNVSSDIKTSSISPIKVNRKQTIQQENNIEQSVTKENITKQSFIEENMEIVQNPLNSIKNTEDLQTGDSILADKKRPSLVSKSSSDRLSFQKQLFQNIGCKKIEETKEGLFINSPVNSEGQTDFEDMINNDLQITKLNTERMDTEAKAPSIDIQKTDKEDNTAEQNTNIKKVEQLDNDNAEINTNADYSDLDHKSEKKQIPINMKKKESYEDNNAEINTKEEV